MRRGNTEVISITDDADLRTLLDIDQPLRFIIRQGGHVLTKENGISISGSTFSVSLTQEETLGFDADASAPKVRAQVKWVDTSGNVRQTAINNIEVQDSLDDNTVTVIDDSGGGVTIH